LTLPAGRGVTWRCDVAVLRVRAIVDESTYEDEPIHRRQCGRVAGTKDEGMTTKRLGRGLGIAMMIVTMVSIPSVAAYADGTCYTGCTPPPITGGGGGSNTGGGAGQHSPSTKSSGSGSGATATATAQSTRSSGGGLPFTGADVEELAVGGVGALLIGGVLVRRSRHRRRAGAS
jgi:hypothetical protein